MAKTARGARILITGAAHGMGLLYARRAVAERARAVHLWDRDAAALQEAARELRALGEVKGGATADGERAAESMAGRAPASVEILPRVVDLGDLDSLAQACDETGAIDVVINNAGVVAGGPYWEQSDESTDAILAVNLRAPMRIVAHLLPGMIARTNRPARIVNVASAAGTLAVPQMSVYVASKWAMIGWSESIRLELERAGHGHVKVTTMAPSYVDTGMFEGVKPPLLTPLLDPQRVVDVVWRAMIAGRPLVLLPWTTKLGMALRGVLPVRAFDLVADKAFGVYDSMTTFVGRG